MKSTSLKSNHLTSRDYGHRNYGNPLFKNKPSNKKHYSVGKLIINVGISSLIIGSIGYAVWYFFWGQTFRIQEIEIQGASAETKTEIQTLISNRLLQKRFFIFSQTSIFVFDTPDIEKSIRDEYFFEKFEIHKKLPRTISVSIKEKTGAVTLIASNKIFLLDDSGYIIRLLNKRELTALKDIPEKVTVDSFDPGTDSIKVADILGINQTQFKDDFLKNSNALPLILSKENSVKKYKPGDQVLSKEMLDLILESYQILPDICRSGIKNFILEAINDTVEVSLKNSWQVYLTTVIPFKTQSERLTLVLKDKIKDKINNLEYIDLRYDERIFFRFKTEKL